MDAIECIKTRRSIRQYKDQPIPDWILDDILDCGRMAPSANNAQRWKFFLTKDPIKLTKLSASILWGKFLKEAAAAIVVVGERGYSHLIEDCGAATENMLLAAHAYGVGTCWIAGHNRDYDADVRSTLGIGAEYELFSIISLGIPKAPASAHGKKGLGEVVVKVS